MKKLNGKSKSIQFRTKGKDVRDTGNIWGLLEKERREKADSWIDGLLSNDMINTIDIGK